MVPYGLFDSKGRQVEFKQGSFYRAHASTDYVILRIPEEELPIHSIVIFNEVTSPTYFIHVTERKGKTIIPFKRIFHPKGKKNRKVFTFGNLDVWSTEIVVGMKAFPHRPAIKWIKMFRNENKKNQKKVKKGKQLVPPFPLERFLHPDDLARFNELP